MKFGNYLKENLLNPWRVEYIQYDLLKMDLKTRQLDHEWNSQDESDFIQLFTNEKTKVTQFIARYNRQLESRIQYSYYLLKGSTTLQQTPQENQETTEFLNNLDDTLIEIIFDIHDFFKFIQLNKLGFAKIMKKHQKWTGIDHTQLPSYEYQTIDSALRSNWTASFYAKVSSIRYQCQQHFTKFHQTNTVEDMDTSVTIPKTIVERRSRKYWILPHHVSEVIATLCMQTHIAKPIEVEKEFDFSMSNVYLDNDYLDTYTDRLADKPNARAIKCKRYGSLSNDSIHLENETHTTFYSRDISSKHRLKVQLSQLNDLYPGSNTTNEEQSNSSLFSEFVQDSNLYSTLKPRIQCDYNRLSFKNHASQEFGLHITLDTDIRFFKKDNQENQPFFSDNGSGVAFPYAVMEVKLSNETKLDDPLLYWLNTFSQKSKLLQEVPKFTKYLQGTFQLHFINPTTDTKLSSPAWAELFKKGFNPSAIHDGLSRSKSLQPLLNGKPYRSTIPYSLGNSLKEKSRQSQQALLRKSYLDNQNKDHISVSMTTLVDKNNKLVLLDLPEKLEVSQNQPLFYHKSSFLLSPSSSFRRKKPTQVIIGQVGDPLKYSNREKINNKKKKLPKLPRIKIEPKIFFANERTFISWLQFCALLLTVALNLLNFGDYKSRVCGAIFLFIAMLLALYALARFEYRAWQLRTPSQTGRFDDIYGPAVLCILIVAALIINFWLRFSHDDQPNHLYMLPQVENNETQ